MHMQRTLPELLAIEGRAVLTMVVSSDCIKKPNATIHSCQRTLAGRSVMLFAYRLRGVTRKTQPQAVKEKIDHRRGVER